MAHSLENALGLASTATIAFVIGGEQIYRAALPLAKRLEITEVEQTPEGDAWFPEIDAQQWARTVIGQGHGYTFLSYSRR